MSLSESDLMSFIDEKNSRQIDETKVKLILYNSLRTLNFVHRANVVHRDIKSSNLLIDSNCNVTICDFGTSRILP